MLANQSYLAVRQNSLVESYLAKWCSTDKVTQRSEQRLHSEPDFKESIDFTNGRVSIAYTVFEKKVPTLPTFEQKYYDSLELCEMA
jgi:hypothetical protein